MSFRCKRKYKLEIKWDAIEYTDVDGTTAKLTNARFEGPALQDAQKVQYPDAIDLDLTPQSPLILGSYYFINLSWQRAEHKSDGTVQLYGAVLISKGLEELHKLNDTDYIEVDTENHQEHIHAFNLVYSSQVVKEDKTPYIYKR